jgi:hypothetical protein
MTHQSKTVTKTTRTSIIDYLVANDSNWYVTIDKNGDAQLKHSTALSNILECGGDTEDYDIDAIIQCGAENDETAEQQLSDAIDSE